jgi:hypothetical protein
MARRGRQDAMPFKFRVRLPARWRPGGPARIHGAFGGCGGQTGRARRAPCGGSSFPGSGAGFPGSCVPGSRHRHPYHPYRPVSPAAAASVTRCCGSPCRAGAHRWKHVAARASSLCHSCGNRPGPGPQQRATDAGHHDTTPGSPDSPGSAPTRRPAGPRQPAPRPTRAPTDPAPQPTPPQEAVS